MRSDVRYIHDVHSYSCMMQCISSGFTMDPLMVPRRSRVCRPEGEREENRIPDPTVSCCRMGCVSGSNDDPTCKNLLVHGEVRELGVKHTEGRRRGALLHARGRDAPVTQVKAKPIPNNCSVASSGQCRRVHGARGARHTHACGMAPKLISRMEGRC
jgi:hypothetical protein